MEVIMIILVFAAFTQILTLIIAKILMALFGEKDVLTRWKYDFAGNSQMLGAETAFALDYSQLVILAEIDKASSDGRSWRYFFSVQDFEENLEEYPLVEVDVTTLPDNTKSLLFIVLKGSVELHRVEFKVKDEDHIGCWSDKFNTVLAYYQKH